LKFTIFYSWQSDLPNSTNRGFIEAELKAVAKEFNSAEAVVIEVDRDTSGVAGSPDIGKTILEKIDAADAFVADLSITNSSSTKARKTPNPNVVFELGWAFKSLSANRVITVMNTAFGGPEDLPFDLKQRRTVKYELRKGVDKANAKKALRDQLRPAIKAIIEAHRQAASGPTLPPPDRAAAALEAIHQARASQDVVAKDFVGVLADDLDRLDPRAKAGDNAQNLVDAIGESRAIVDDFGRVAQLAAAEKATEAVHGLVQGIEQILRRYQFQGTSGSHHTTDFDFFKFVGHELGAVLAGHLVRAERWHLVRSLFDEKIHAHDPFGGSREVGIERLSAHLVLLEDLSKAKRRVSVHADLLSERHEASPPTGGLSLVEFLAGDLLLCLGTHRAGTLWWYPRSATYLSGRTPRFLSAATQLPGAKNLAAALGETDLAAMKARVKQAIGDLLTSLHQMDVWGVDLFNLDLIATA
jgi:hypothetical protein